MLHQIVIWIVHECSTGSYSSGGCSGHAHMGVDAFQAGRRSHSECQPSGMQKSIPAVLSSLETCREISPRRNLLENMQTVVASRAEVLQAPLSRQNQDIRLKTLHDKLMTMMSLPIMKNWPFSVPGMLEPCRTSPQAGTLQGQSLSLL
jgi:hypothetical protein